VKVIRLWESVNNKIDEIMRVNNKIDEIMSLDMIVMDDQVYPFNQYLL
jgi:hypothetical protein